MFRGARVKKRKGGAYFCTANLDILFIKQVLNGYPHRSSRKSPSVTSYSRQNMLATRHREHRPAFETYNQKKLTLPNAFGKEIASQFWVWRGTEFDARLRFIVSSIRLRIELQLCVETITTRCLATMFNEKLKVQPHAAPSPLKVFVRLFLRADHAWDHTWILPWVELGFLVSAITRC